MVTRMTVNRERVAVARACTVFDDGAGRYESRGLMPDYSNYVVEEDAENTSEI